MVLRDDMERIYREIPQYKIPWCMEKLPCLLEDVLQHRRLVPCRAVDLGCGTGMYTVELAGRGFEMTGVDFSESAIELARTRTRKAGVSCRFVVANLLHETEAIGDTFEAAIEWEVLHHIFPKDRPGYLSNVHRLLRPGGRYLSVSFSEESPQFGGRGKYRKTPLGTVLYHSSEEELRELFESFFEILELSTIKVAGKFSPHLANFAFLQRRD